MASPGNSRILVETALRVLSTWNAGRAPESRDIDVLRQTASPWWPEMSFDQLACEIVSRETQRVLEDSQREREKLRLRRIA